MNKTTCTALEQNHLTSLELPTFVQEYEKVASQAAIETLDHLAYLQRLCELERIEQAGPPIGG